MVDALSIDGSGGSVGRAVAHYSDSNVSVLGTRHLVAGTQQRLVGFSLPFSILISRVANLSSFSVSIRKVHLAWAIDGDIYG